MYEYSVAKNVATRLLNRDDFLSILSSKNIESAVKTIAEKPIGTHLYQIIRSGIYSITDIEREIDLFNLERLKNFKQTCKKDKIYVIDSFEKLFDAINLTYMILNMIHGGKPSIIYPAGNIADLDLSSISSLDELKAALGKELAKVYDLVMIDGFHDYNMLFSAMSTLKHHLLLGSKVRRVYGFIRDAHILKTCFVMEQEPSRLPPLITMSRENFINICKSRDLDQLKQSISDINPLYRGFSELLNDVYGISKNLSIIDFAILLYASHISRDLIYTYEEVIARIYVLLVSEALMLKTVLTNIWFNTHIEHLKNLVNKWWPL